MYRGKKISIVFGTYKERGTIKRIIDDFWKTGFVDEIIVVNNNAELGTDTEVKKTKAKLVHENRQGFGWAYQKALDQARGDYIVTCEPDGSFSASDIEKFLLFAQEFDVVLGSRTSLIPSLSFPGMGEFRKFGNVLEAKIIEILFNTNALTDVGCTYKLIKRSVYDKIRKSFKHTSALFNTELVLLIVSGKFKFVEIPVSYKKRSGKSNIVGTRLQAIKWAIIIQVYILLFWVSWLIESLDYKKN